ncbi:translocation/assembly module TamB domain-containing protein [Niveibacterium sp. SC-1]|uniref:translocation/assembly module TamB domain-containing protein n=1 Tax=Niveibacterium sp. SC-1 TaxID=3135646 RepID=UPI00311E2AB3
MPGPHEPDDIPETAEGAGGEAPPEEGAASAPETPAAPPRRPWWRRALSRPIAMSLGLAAAVLPWFGLYWVVGTEEGFRATARFLDHLTRGELHIERPAGRLLDGFSAEHFRLHAGPTRVELSGVAIRWRPVGLLRGMIDIDRASVRTLTVSHTSVPKPPSTPLSFALPVTIHARELQLQHFDLFLNDVGEPSKRVFGLRDASASDLRLDLARWQAARIDAQTDWGRANLRKVDMAPLAPFKLTADGGFATRYDVHDAQFAVTLSGSLSALDVDARGGVDRMAVKAQAEIRSFDHMPIGRLALEAGEVDPHNFSPHAPHAALTLRADLRPVPLPHGVPEAAHFGGLRVEGPIEIVNGAPGLVDAGRIPVQRLAGQLSATGSEIGLRGLDLRLLGSGIVRGDVRWQPSSDTKTDPIGKVEGELLFQAIDPSQLYAGLPAASLAGRAQAQATAGRQTLQTTLSDGRFALDLRGYQHAGKVVAEAFALRSADSRLEGKGSIELSGKQAFAADIQTTAFNPRAFWKQAPEGAITGSLRAQGAVLPHLSLDADLSLTQSQLAGYPLVGEGKLSLDGKRLSKADVQLEVVGNKATVSGAFGAPGDTLNFRVTANELQRLGKGFNGRVRARGTLTGSLAQPAGRLEVFVAKLEAPGGHRLDALNFSGELSEGRNGTYDARLTVAGYRPPNSATPLLRRASMVAKGVRDDHAVQLEAEFAGSRSIAFQAQGGFAHGSDWKGELKKAALNLETELVLTEPAPLEFGPTHFLLDAAHFRGEHAELDMEQLRWTPAQASAKGKLTGLRLGLTLNDAQQVVARGDTLQLGAEWDLDLREHANGLVRVYREAGDIILEGDSPVALGLTELETIFAANQDQVAVSVSAAGKRIGVISASATASLRRAGSFWEIAREAPLLGSARIEVPSIDWIGPVIDPNMRSGGSVQGDFSLAGTPADPVASGSISGSGLKIILADQGLRLTDGVLKVGFEGGRIKLDEMSFVSPIRVRPDEKRILSRINASQPGRILLKGDIDLVTGVGDFLLNVDRVAAAQRPDLWLMVSGDGRLRTSGKEATLNAKIAAVAGYIGYARKPPPRLDPDVQVRGRATEVKEHRFRTTVDVELDMGDALYLKALGVDTRLAGKLQLFARPGEGLRATGQIEARDGVYDAYGQRLAIDEGLITFQGPVANPTLSVRALRKGLQVEAGVEISGSAQRPRVKLVSSPNVPDAEKLSWIVLGRPPNNSGNEGDAALLVAAAGALMGDTAGGITNDIQKAFGFDQIMIAQGDTKGLGGAAVSQVTGSATGFSSSTAAAGAQDSVTGEVIMIGKRVTDDVYLSFEQSLQGTESLVKLTYALTRTVSVIVRGGTDVALDLNYNVSFR